ncbi:hypothetical protein EG329_006304 [Mollisiaceae sp. DMI_Dod_QoI]|nr:hypothetical protein EG329_006304 [Helotiales sp. DMI_Dod_QoI]
MTDPTMPGSPFFSRPTHLDSSFSTSPYADISPISGYAQTSQHDSLQWPTAPYPPYGYGSSGMCATCYQPKDRCVCNHIGGTPDDGIIMEEWWCSKDPQGMNSMECGFDQGDEWGGTDHDMTGIGEQQGRDSFIEGSDDQRPGKPPEISAVGMMEVDPYSSTNVEAGSSHSYRDGSPEVTINNQPRSSRSLQNVGNEEQAGWREAELEANFHPTRCVLDGCRGAYIFKTLQSYRSHLKNVHTKDIYCPVSGCRHHHARPFASKNDLDRHRRARHEPEAIKPFRCERIRCMAKVKAWLRKDKLRDHDKKHHMNLLCHICSHYFDDFEELSEHTNFGHAWFGREEGNR